MSASCCEKVLNISRVFEYFKNAKNDSEVLEKRKYCTSEASGIFVQNIERIVKEEDDKVLDFT